MYFDFDGRHEDYEPIGGKLRRWDGVLLSVGAHVVAFVIFLFAPLPSFLQASPTTQAEMLRPEPEEEQPRFVFVQPRVDMPAPEPPKRAELSDINRRASSEPVLSRNELPFARGNSAERVETAPDERARGRGPEPEPRPEAPAETVTPPAEVPEQRAQTAIPTAKPQPPQGGSLGDAIRNLQKYVEKESFNNPQGGSQNLGPLQFDTKGVEFGPWIRRFVAQVRRNWFVPYAAMSMRGHVVLTFYVHRNGALTDVKVIEPSSVPSFTTAAMNALLASNPTEPLPPAYPDDKAFFTVTFYYNESPGGR